MQQEVEYRANGRLVLLGDHTKAPKDGRKIPAVRTLHQDSQTASKPTFFQGHHRGCVALLLKSADKCFAASLEARIHEGLELFEQLDGDHLPKTVRIVQMARGPSCISAKPLTSSSTPISPWAPFSSGCRGTQRYARSAPRTDPRKKNAVAYVRAPKKRKGKRGPQKQYGKKLKLMKLFGSRPHHFQTTEVTPYGKPEEVRYLALNPLWNPSRERFASFSPKVPADASCW